MKINNKISSIYGELKPGFEKLEGAGLMDWIKRKGYVAKEKVKTFFSPKLDVLIINHNKH
jgi:hypothetical protein